MCGDSVGGGERERERETDDDEQQAASEEAANKDAARAKRRRGGEGGGGEALFCNTWLSFVLSTVPACQAHIDYVTLINLSRLGPPRAFAFQSVCCYTIVAKDFSYELRGTSHAFSACYLRVRDLAATGKRISRA